MSYFLLETAENGNSQCRFFAGPDYYYFPYKKAGSSTNSTWNIVEITYSSWDCKQIMWIYGKIVVQAINI